jgi:hypothetical protein
MHIYGYLNRADRLLVEAAQCGGAADEETASKFWHGRSKGSLRWYVLHKECASYGYSTPLIWAISKYPNIQLTGVARAAWLAAASNNHIDFLESIICFYEFKPPRQFISTVIVGGAKLETVKWLLLRGAKDIDGAYTAAVKALDFELAEYIESITYECGCGRQSDIVPVEEYDCNRDYSIKDFNNANIKLEARCRYGECNLVSLSTPDYSDAWRRVLAEADVKTAKYLSERMSYSDQYAISNAIAGWSRKSGVDRIAAVEMLSWMHQRGLEVHRWPESLYLFAAGLRFGHDDAEPVIDRAPDLEMIKYLHANGCEIGTYYAPMVFFRSAEVYEWASANIPAALSITGENILVSVIEYGEPKLVEKLLVGVVPTQRILSALLEYSYYDIFDNMWKQFYNRGNNTRV